jgi:hypothetical protein
MRFETIGKPAPFRNPAQFAPEDVAAAWDVHDEILLLVRSRCRRTTLQQCCGDGIQPKKRLSKRIDFIISHVFMELQVMCSHHIVLFWNDRTLPSLFPSHKKMIVYNHFVTILKIFMIFLTPLYDVS